MIQVRVLARAQIAFLKYLDWYTYYMDPQQTEHQQIKDLLQDNKRLISENNDLLRRMNRMQRWSMAFRIFWFFLIIGGPFVLYYWVLEPYFTNLGSSFETFEKGLQEVPGWKQFYEAMGGTVE